MNARFVARIRLLASFFIVVSILIVGRLYFLQVMQGKTYAARADAQFIEPESPLMERDSIFFTDKNGETITAATLKSGFLLAVNPTKVENPEALYKAVSSYVPLSHEDFIAKATKQGTQYQVVAQHLESDVGKKLQALSLPGLILAQDRWRLYPGGSLAAQELGFVAYNGDAQEGRYGLERYYEQTLMRESDTLYSNFFAQLFGAAQSIIEGHQTGDVITTIEPSVQAELERTLATYASDWHPALSGGIIMDPKTGEIYAMAVSPTFDLNQFNKEKDPLIFANPMVENVYEMGSIMKPLTMAAGLDSGAIIPNTTYNDTGCITVDTKKICNFDLKPRGVIPMQEVLSQSLNVGASFIATRMGTTTMSDYLLNHYRLNQESGIDLPGEVHGLVDNLKNNRQVEYDTAAFGQGIAVTPIEMARGLATLANGGYLVTPHLVSAVRYDSGITKTLSWGEPKKVLKTETTEEVSQMLTKVVDDALANGTIKLEHYSVAAKTGTAQIPNPAGGGYYPDKYLHSFFGYFPSYSAKFIIFLFAYKPEGAPFASQTWAQPFHTLTQFLINYYNIPPDR